MKKNVTGKTFSHLRSMISNSLTTKQKVEQKVTRYHAVESGSLIAFAMSHPMQVIFSFEIFSTLSLF